MQFSYYLDGLNLITVTILAFFSGYFVINNIRFFKNHHIPEGVIGGMLFCMLIFILKSFFGIKINIDKEMRDIFLLIFFCTVGMAAKIGALLNGGKRLVKLIIVMIFFVTLQNTIGVTVAINSGADPINGLLAGSISLIGGHGTAISWGSFFESKGYEGAIELGLISATIGLLLGGTIGSPLGVKLIHLYKLRPRATKAHQTYSHNLHSKKLPASVYLVLQCFLFICLCVKAGESIHTYLSNYGYIMPRYLPVLFCGMIIINILDSKLVPSRNLKISTRMVAMFNDVSLQIFVTMSMMSIEIEYLFDKRIVSLLLIIFVQTVFAVMFGRWIFFRIAGKDYDSALMTAGFIGTALGATPVALANVVAISKKYGPSPKALLIVPFLGSVFTDIINVICLQLFLMLPFFNM
jgi:ESS family glutamate:Na+ symporter